MQKLIRGIIDFHETKSKEVRELFAKLALGQKPDCFFIACSDSRVAANVFASTDPGDLFVIRNVGNIVPPYPYTGSAVAALEFAVNNLKVGHIVVCGHSDCGAMHALSQSRDSLNETPLGIWLRHAQKATTDFKDVDGLSQKNVALQLDNLRSHPLVKEKENAGEIRLHGLWFNIRDVEVYYLESPPDKFVLIDSRKGDEILSGLEE